MASRAETKKKQIEKKAKAANLSVAEYKKAMKGQGDSALAKRQRSRISKVETGAKVAAGIGTMFIPGFGTVALGAKALKAFSAPMKLSKVKKLGGKIRKNPTKAQIKNAKNVSPDKIIKKAEESKIKKLDLTKGKTTAKTKPKAKLKTSNVKTPTPKPKSKPTTKAKTPEKQPSRLEKIARTTTRIGVTKGRRTGEALRSKTGRLSGISKKDIRLGENIRRGAGVGAASVALMLGARKKQTERSRLEADVPLPKPKPKTSNIALPKPKPKMADVPKSKPKRDVPIATKKRTLKKKPKNVPVATKKRRTTKLNRVNRLTADISGKFGVGGKSKTGSTRNDYLIGFSDGQGGKGPNYDRIMGMSSSEIKDLVAKRREFFSKKK
tara:strand:- start:561 stop:1703 length:1143 start_codon:yes stop_codon:yes gene_type:complete